MQVGTKAQHKDQYAQLRATSSRSKPARHRMLLIERAAERRIRRQGKKEALTCDC
jgi:hypothetical protein